MTTYTLVSAAAGAPCLPAGPAAPETLLKHLTSRCLTFSDPAATRPRRRKPGKSPLQGLSPRPPPWVTIGPRKEFQMAGESTPHAGGNKGGWHSGRFAHTFAAIDLGTNNCRLLVARASVDGYEVIDAYSRPVRLGEGVALNGSLCGEAIERTLHALVVCASKIERHKVSRARHIATEACRRACNGSTSWPW